MTRWQRFCWNWLGVWIGPARKPHRCPGCGTTWIIDKNLRVRCDDCTGGS